MPQPIPRVPIGIGAPNVLAIPLVSPGPAKFGIDLRTVTAVTFRVFDPNGAEVTAAFTGAGSIAAGVTETAGTALYAFTGAEGLVEGTYKIAPVLVTPGGPVPCSNVPFEASRIPGD